MELLLGIFALLSVPSAIGGAFYFCCRRIRPTPILFGFILFSYIACIGITGLFYSGVVLLCPIAVVSAFGTWLHRKTITLDDSDWYHPYQLVVPTAVFISLTVSTFFALVFDYSFLLSSKAIILRVSVPTFLFIILTSPSLSPLLILAWRNMKLQPGVDKHFDE